jgi:RNA polymerase sigma factor (sigma-70 family)
LTRRAARLSGRGWSRTTEIDPPADRTPQEPAMTATATRHRPVANATLLHAAGEGHQPSWEEIVRRYRGLVTSVVRSYRLQDADARDAEQRTWLRLVENLPRVRDPARLGGWLATTASRECLHIIRESRGSTVMELDLLPDPGHTVEDQVVDADTLARVRTIVASLPDRGRTIMAELFADERRPYADVARATGIPVGSLGPTRRRLLERVRRSFEAPVGV